MADEEDENKNDDDAGKEKYHIQWYADFAIAPEPYSFSKESKAMWHLPRRIAKRCELE